MMAIVFSALISQATPDWVSLNHTLYDLDQLIVEQCIQDRSTCKPASEEAVTFERSLERNEGK